MLGLPEKCTVNLIFKIKSSYQEPKKGKFFQILINAADKTF